MLRHGFIENRHTFLRNISSDTLSPNISLPNTLGETGGRQKTSSWLTDSPPLPIIGDYAASARMSDIAHVTYAPKHHLLDDFHAAVKKIQYIPESHPHLDLLN